MLIVGKDTVAEKGLLFVLGTLAEDPHTGTRGTLRNALAAGVSDPIIELLARTIGTCVKWYSMLSWLVGTTIGRFTPACK